MTPWMTATTNAIRRPWWFLTSLNGVATDHCIHFCGRTEGENATNALSFPGEQVCPPPPANPLQEEYGQAFSVKKRFFATKGLPFRHEKCAASTSKTGRMSTISYQKMFCFLGKGMLPKSKKRQTFRTHLFVKLNHLCSTGGKPFGQSRQ